MNKYKEIIKNILIEEFSKINNVNYYFRSSNLLIKVNIKRLIPSLINQCSYFEAGINSNLRFQKRNNCYFWLSYDHLWLKFEKETSLKYDVIQSLVKSVLEEGFNLKGMTPLHPDALSADALEEGFNLKGMTPTYNKYTLMLFSI
jgi:hypothetical protein